MSQNAESKMSNIGSLGVLFILLGSIFGLLTDEHDPSIYFWIVVAWTGVYLTWRDQRRNS